MDFVFGDFLRASTYFIVFYTGLILIVTTDRFISKTDKRTFLVVIILCTLHAIFNYIDTWSSRNMDLVKIRTVASIAGFSIRPFIILFFLKLSEPKQKHVIWLIFSIINMLLYVTSPLTHLCIYFTNDNSFHHGPLWTLIYILCIAGLLYITIRSITNHYKSPIRRWILPPIGSLLIVNAVYVDRNSTDIHYPTMLNKMLPAVIFLFYIFYHLALAEQYEKEILQKQQLQLMYSQIKPHFLYNTITTIQALCHIDPKKASDTLGTFATYIRQNVTTQTQNLIPFSQELQHIKTYVDIEMLRFANIEVQYDLQITDFEITAFSIQPLIENSIKHGIRSKEHGVVILRTLKTDGSISVIIEDNGIGFDISILDSLDNTHIGINNVRNRLNLLQNATMHVASNSAGTTISINIPWEN